MDLKGLGFEITETMSGWMGVGQSDFQEGESFGKTHNTSCSFSVKIEVDDLDSFFKLTGHQAKLTGSFDFTPLGKKIPIENGKFNLFSLNNTSGDRRMVYEFNFTDAEGQKCHFQGFKEVKDDPGLDVTSDMTTLFSIIYRGENDQGQSYASGKLLFDFNDAPEFIASMKVTNARYLWQKVAGFTAFMSFAYGALRNEYLSKILPYYLTEYENLILSGVLTDSESNEKPFFMVSGVHDKGFPWGDAQPFSDLLLVIGDQSGGYDKYCITDFALNGLELNVEKGLYEYRGPIFRLISGHSTSFNRMRRKSGELEECQAELNIRFKATPYAVTPLPFIESGTVRARIAHALKEFMSNILPSINLPGIFITPHEVKIVSGTIRLSGTDKPVDFSIREDRSFGEAERSTINMVKEPTLYYHYICAIEPDRKSARVQIESRTLRNDRSRWIKDKIDAIVGRIASRIASIEISVRNGVIKISKLKAPGISKKGVPRFEKIGQPVMEINNDHLKTGVLQRNIVRVRRLRDEYVLGLEENMNQMRLEAVGSEKSCVVASIKGAKKKGDLEDVLNLTGFSKLLDDKLELSRKSRDQFLIVIKPNFMFAYNKRDRSTFTDPGLVGHLVEVINAMGYKNVVVVESQSTYGEYYDKRSVREVAGYLGYDISSASNYRVVDLSEDSFTTEYLGSYLGSHPVPNTWRDADFRISFAKNKTHAYANYTLTIKNIYGALALPNKFKEYHCDRDIYHSTIEYMRAFPIHYGLIDAYLSADGPFGIFADPDPNETKTLIGGQDLVAVDWVGASKMGIDPMLSKYIRLAVDAFGKPEIELIGDPRPYYPWLNVSNAVTFMVKGLDINHYIGNLIYKTTSYMDEKQFTHKDKSIGMVIARRLLKPVQETIFLPSSGKPTKSAKILCTFFKWLAK
jgi:uncharacterized protein (DUF362 family)